jgi:hypothetical protein
MPPKFGKPSANFLCSAMKEAFAVFDFMLIKGKRSPLSGSPLKSSRIARKHDADVVAATLVVSGRRQLPAGCLEVI